MNAPLPVSPSAWKTISPAEVADLSVPDLLSRLRTKPDGLTWEEAAQHGKIYGPNELINHKPPGWPAVLWASIRNPFNGVLLSLAIVSTMTGDLKATIVMLLMVTLSTGLRFWQEMKATIQADSLRSMVHNFATVVRQGDRPTDLTPNDFHPLATDIPLRQLVPGDIVLLSAGDMIPGDLRLLESRDLFVSQSALTGEAMPVEKFAAALTAGAAAPAMDASQPALERACLVFMGTSIVSGTGRAVVAATGGGTLFGSIAARLVAQRPPTAFDIGVNKVSWLLIRFMLVMVPVVFLINGMVKHEWLEAFFFSIAIAVGLTPEMLPMIVNANLARGARILAKNKTIVKHLSAIQNFGAMDILCTDKTGTLTQDRVVLTRHLDIHGVETRRVLLHACLNSVHQTGLKNLIDRAVIDKAQEEEVLEETRDFVKIDEVPFDFQRRRMSVILRARDGSELLVCKGAMEEMLEVCSHVEDNGIVVPITEALRDQCKARRDNLNSNGMRTLAVAHKAIGPADYPFNIADEHELILTGLVAFLDPPKDTALEALRLLQEHGVEVKILTGDNAIVTNKVCRDVGLPVKATLEGRELEGLDEAAFSEAAARGTIFAKLSPMQKASLVAALKKQGHTVGFMGDGINDAPALREADVGISVDSAVDVAKEAADIILLEKSLLVLGKGVIEGRRTFGNIIKYIKMTASSNFGNVFSVLVASAFLPFLPMLAMQLLVQNLLYDFSQISIPWDRMDEDFLKKPRQWDAGTITRFMIWIGPLSSIFDIITFFVMWHVFGANTLAHEGLFQSGWFVVGLLTQTLIVHMIRTEKVPFFESTAAPAVLAGTGLVMAVGLWLPFSPLAPALKMEPLPAPYFLFLLLLLTAYCLLTQTVKKIYIRRFGNWL